jgi:hypothetical protein
VEFVEDEESITIYWLSSSNKKADIVFLKSSFFPFKGAGISLLKTEAKAIKFLLSNQAMYTHLYQYIKQILHQETNEVKLLYAVHLLFL